MREGIIFNSNKMIKNVLIEINKYYFFVYILNEYLFYIC